MLSEVHQPSCTLCHTNDNTDTNFWTILRIICFFLIISFINKLSECNLNEKTNKYYIHNIHNKVDLVQNVHTCIKCTVRDCQFAVSVDDTSLIIVFI